MFATPTFAAPASRSTVHRSRRWRTSLALLATIGLLAGCGSNASSTAGASGSSSCEYKGKIDTVKPGQLTVAAYDAPPYIGVSGSDLTGIDGEILTEVAHINCLKAVPMHLPFPSVVAAVTAGRADVASGDFYGSTEREKTTALTHPAYADRLAIVSKGGELGSISDLEGKRIGSLQGDTWNIALTKVVGSGFKAYQSQQAVYTDFKAGRLDAVIDAVASAPEQIKLNGISGAESVVPPADDRIDSTVKPPLNTYPVHLGNTSLVEAINSALDKMRSNGDLAKILTKYGYSPDAQKLPNPYYLIGS